MLPEEEQTVNKEKIKEKGKKCKHKSIVRVRSGSQVTGSSHRFASARKNGAVRFVTEPKTEPAFLTELNIDFLWKVSNISPDASEQFIL